MALLHCSPYCKKKFLTAWVLGYYSTNNSRETLPKYYFSDISGLEFFETSAKENINVKAVFERLVDIICDKMSESLDSDPTIINNPQTKRLTENPQAQNQGCQC